MNEKFKNVVCEPKDFFQEKKRQIFELINLNKTVCNNLPDLSIPNLITGLTDLNPIQKIIELF
jgi:N-acetyl-anhydromuramyl-L-alanine amidase AmpD